MPDIEIGYGPRSKWHVIVGFLPPRSWRPYEGRAETACGKTLAGLIDNAWVDGDELAARRVCARCVTRTLRPTRPRSGDVV